MGEIITTVDTLVNTSVRLFAVKEGIKLKGKQDMQSKVMVTMFGLFADIERDLISIDWVLDMCMRRLLFAYTT